MRKSLWILGVGAALMSMAGTAGAVERMVLIELFTHVY